jgi:alanine racemase
VELEGLFSHFAAADEKDKGYVREQLARFRETIRGIEAEGIRIPLKHIAESAAILEIPLRVIRSAVMVRVLWLSPQQ